VDQSNAGGPIQTFSPRRAGKIVETKLVIYSFVELQIQQYSKRHCKCRLAGALPIAVKLSSEYSDFRSPNLQVWVYGNCQQYE